MTKLYEVKCCLYDSGKCTYWSRPMLKGQCKVAAEMHEMLGEEHKCSLKGRNIPATQ